jgi:hypothetical protein
MRSNSENKHTLDVLTINEDSENEDELIEIVGQACKYFPKGTWRSIEYLGNLNIEHDVKVVFDARIYGAFILERLLRRIRKLKNMFKILKLLLGITSNPIVTFYYKFETGNYQRIVNIVHDYVSDDVGVVSLFKAKDVFAKMLIAHGLGHNRGLTHHFDPVDLMCIDLLNYPMLDKKNFCKECIIKLRKTN